MSHIRVGIDIGGTFTDVVLTDDESVHVAKVLTTPDDPAEGALVGFRKILALGGIRARDVGVVTHATTLVANALVERSGARVGLITTAGFSDTLELAREKRFDLYDLFLEIPSPLVPPDRCRGVSERTDADGNILSEVDLEEVLSAAAELRAQGAQSIAINFLHAPMNPMNEEVAEAALRKRYPEMWISRSSGISPEIGEYERCSTVAANAYVQPLVDRYMEKLSGGMRKIGFGGRFSIMLSTGGFTGVESVRRAPIRVVESGPAGGALAAAQVARSCGKDRAIGFDMGGTTAKICLIREGEPDTANSFEVSRTSRFQKGSGLPILVPSVDLVEIGAGGGSIAHVNRMGLAQVGPGSAGSNPGPACYGLGGTEPTVTDANLLLGYLNPDYFLGGEMPLSVQEAEKALEGLARELSVTIENAAWGVHELVSEQMASAARVHIAEKGADPRRFSLIATGGAGPAHACHMARKLHVRRVVFPPSVGVASTIGLLMARSRSDVVRAYVSDVDEIDWKRAHRLLGEMEVQALSEIMAPEEKGKGWERAITADMRYRGQSDTVAVPLPNEVGGLPGEEAGMKKFFENAYLLKFGRKMEGVPVEVAAWRLTLMGPKVDNVFGGLFFMEERETFSKGVRRMFDGVRREFVEGEVYDRYALPVGDLFSGPAVIEERESTIVIPGDAVFVKDKSGNIRATLEG
jgi:N-methylhydantoinase A/oxoprolinase/acetone carboxylase beta subunit